MKRPFPRRAIHIDFHTMPGVPDLGSKFNPEEFAGTLADAGVEYINAFAKCNTGFAYYPTRVGVEYPGMKLDLLGGMVDACHKRNIGVSAYFNVGLDHEQMSLHRDWCRMNRNGQVYMTDRPGHFRLGCLNTPYADYLLGMIKEVIEGYPVDGIFLDCMFITPCYGLECIERMRSVGIDPADDIAVAEYNRTVMHGFIDKVNALIEESGKDLYAIYNGMSYVSQPTHIEMEVLPTGGWGYDCLPTSIRYARTLGKPYLTMTGRFHKTWGDFGGLRSVDSMLFDCYNSIANGGACSIGDHLHPCGELTPGVYDNITEVYKKTSALDPWADGASSVAEIAVLAPTMDVFPEAVTFGVQESMTISARGAARMLSELKMQFDVCGLSSDLSKYRLLILPDNVELDKALADRIKAFLDSGGKIISSAKSGQTGGEFVLPEYKMKNMGEESFKEAYVKACAPLAPGMPDMMASIYDTGIILSPEPGSEVLAETFYPYFKMLDWNWKHIDLYTPPNPEPTGRPAALRSGNIIHFAFPVFAGYFDHAPLHYRTLLKNALELLLPEPLARAENMPSFGQVTLTTQRDRLIAHLVAYVPEMRGRKAQVIEEPAIMKDVKLSVRLDGRRVSRVYQAPSKEPLAFAEDGGYIRITVPEARGYAMVVME